MTSAALLESTSLVFAHGLDLFSTRVMPSGTFDILSDSFNKAQLVLTILGLTVGIIVVKVRSPPSPPEPPVLLASTMTADLTSVVLLVYPSRSWTGRDPGRSGSKP